ncbi:MAG: hypothetical protein ACXADB_05600 [Candidatus Hermodarchaeia archaeon]
MKIVYSCSNRIGAGVQLTRFLRRMEGSEHEVRIAGFRRPTESITHIDWTLDAMRHRYSSKNKQGLIELFGYHGLPDVGFKELSILLEEISEYNPDLVICDAEPIVANIAKVLGFRLWYCSPLHLLDGVKWGPGQIKYRARLEKHRKLLDKLPIAERVFVYSPFGDIEGTGPELKSGYEWMQPYHHCGDTDGAKSGGVAILKDGTRISILSKILNCVPPFDLTLFSRYKYDLSHLVSVSMLDQEGRDKYRDIVSRSSWVFTTGETSFVADAVYNGAKVCVAPDLNDPETLLNATLIEQYGLGDDVAQVELMESYAVGTIEKSYSSWADTGGTLKNTRPEVLLHTELEKLCE